MTTRLEGTSKRGGRARSPLLRATPEPTIRLIHDLEYLDELEGAWDRLADRSGSPMQYHAWARACAASFTGDRTLQIIVVGSRSHPEAIAPLIRRRTGLGRLEFLGMNVLDEPADFVYADPSALVPLAEALVRSGRPVFLGRLPADSSVVSALQMAIRGRGVVICRPVGGCPWMALDAGWTQPEQQLNAGRRSDLRRARRLAEAMGAVRCEVLSPAPGQLDPLLEEAFGVEAAGWKGRQGSALRQDSQRRRFFQRYATAAAEKGILRLCFLRIGGHAAATQLAVECGERFWLLKIGYDEAFRRCSPGVLLLLETVRYAAARGLRSFEFLGTVEPWTQVWTQGAVRPYLSVRLYPGTAPGMAALAVDVGRHLRGRLAHRARVWG